MIRRLCSALLGLLLVATVSAQGLPGIGIEGPFVRVKRNDDGSKTVFERGQDEKTLTKKTFTAGGNLTLKTVYRLDSRGNPLKCDIYDGIGNKLYKTAFAYSKRPGPTYGKLAQELLYDTRVKRFRPGTKEEMPVHAFIYKYRPDGSAEVPVGITLIKGKTADQVFGKSQALPNLNELEEGDASDAAEPANPSARPLGRARD
ncbi:hypothetical protein [Haloferula sargassicola]|uniref:DUF3108 domain-containing protein n=1 Tax=Haloferula sargassicola TaxID=490096 RepID=A0ABP9UJ96_9BACT